MKRVLTAAVALPITILITLFSPVWLFALVIGLVCGFAVEEFLSLAEKKGMGRPGRWFLVPAALVTVSFIGGLGWVVPALVGAAIVLMTAAVFAGPIETAFARVATGIGGIVYCGLTLGFLISMSIVLPRSWIVVLLAIIWVGDTAAYYCGRAFGRHLLAPKVSPKKTVEGAVAGLIGSVAAGLIGGAWIIGETTVALAGIVAVTAAAGQVGDLAESVLKRAAAQRRVAQ